MQATRIAGGAIGWCVVSKRANSEVDGNASSEATFGLQLRDGEQHFESWRVEADGRGRLESPGEILVLKAIYGDWLTAEGELQLGPGHR